MLGDGRHGTNGFDNPSTETNLSLDGLSVTDDAVLVDYESGGTADEGTKWTITASSAGDRSAVDRGRYFLRTSGRLTATVTGYADSDCTIEAYGE